MDDAADDEDDKAEVSLVSDENDQAAVFDRFEASFKNVPTSLDEINKKNWMLQLELTAKGQLLAYIGKQAKVLWPLDEPRKAF